MAARYNLASMPIQNMSKIDNLAMVVKEISGCYEKILVAIATSMCPTGVHGCLLQSGVNAYSKYVKY